MSSQASLSPAELPSPTSTIAEATRVAQVSPGRFVSVYGAQGQPSNPRVVFGGFTIAVGLRAACHDVDTSQYALYSCLGTFLGPATGGRRLHVEVTPLRSTRTFQTRRVDILQLEEPEGDESGDREEETTTTTKKKKKKKEGKRRFVMTLTADFIRPETRSLLAYEPPAQRAWTRPEDCAQSQPVMDEARRRYKDVASRAYIDILLNTGAAAEVRFERRSAPEGWLGQVGANVLGSKPVPMDAAPPTAKGTGEWYRLRTSCNNYVETLATMVHLMDHGIAFQVGNYNRIGAERVAAQGSLEFALRLFAGAHGFVWRDAHWLLYEETPLAAGAGTLYNEVRLRTPGGAVLASLTEQCILRPAKKDGAVAKM